MPKNPPPADWPGFYAPHYTPIPDDLFDLWLPSLSGAELKVLLYICRRTFGWKKDRDAISLAQITRGIQRRDGTALDHGTGLAESTAVLAVKGLVSKGLIVTERTQDAAGGDSPTVYRPRLRLAETPAPDNRRPPSPISAVLGLRQSETQETPSRDMTQEAEGPEFSYAEHEVMRRAGITPDEYRALRGPQ